MSQNSHKLLLFFSDANQYKQCYRILKLLEADRVEEAQIESAEFGVDFTSVWQEHWFNQSITPTKTCLVLDYDTSTHYSLPLEILNQLFNVGLRAACLEVFYDQVGEFGQFFFAANQLVEREALCDKFPRIKKLLDEHFECDSDELDGHGYTTPITIKKLMKQHIQQDKEAEEMVNTVLALAKASRESGENPLEIARSALVLREAGKGGLQGIAFGVVTILLFKGFWLWLILGIVLTVLLPLIYVSKLTSDLDDDDDSERDEEQEEEAC